MANILLIEDERLVRQMINDYFTNHHETIIEASNGHIGLDILRHNQIDLVILDIMMPGINGYEVCKQIRLNSDIPIIIISTLNKDNELLKGYEFGCDDFITKPFAPSLLLAKAHVLLKRSNHYIANIKKFGQIEVDINTHIVYKNKDQINLSPKEYKLLVYFIDHANTIITREQLLNALWGYDYLGDLRVVDTYIKKLRKKLSPYNYIQTIVKSGYIFKECETDEIH